MKKTIKNIMIVCLLVLATIVVAPKVLATISGTTGKIVVQGLEEDKVLTATAYQLMTVNIENGQPKEPVYTWDSKVAAWLRANDYEEFVVDGTNDVSDNFNSTTSVNLSEFYDKLATAIRADITATTDADETTTSAYGFENLTHKSADSAIGTTTAEITVEMGHHLVLVENGMRVYKPMAANVVPEYSKGEWNIKNGEITEKMILEAKSSTPHIEKEVVESDSSVKVGDVLTYKLTVFVPQYPAGTKNKLLTVGDVFSNGLEFVEITNVKGNGVTPLTENTNYKVTEPTADNNNTLTIDFGGSLYDANSAYSTIEVTYTARITEDAEVEDPINNTATLTYNPNPYKDSDSATDDTEVDVYTYGLKLTKVGTEEEDLDGLAGVIFNVTKGNDTLCFKASDNGYTYTGTGTCSTGSSADVTTPANGLLVLNGLDEGEYKLTETFAPNGYIKLKAPITLTIKDADEEGKVDGTLELVKTDTTGAAIDGRFVTITVTNTKSIIDLPVTGGIGTLIFSIVGMLFMGTSVVLVRNILKKKEVQL